MNQERMRCILFQPSEWPMGVGLSSKHWALRSHSFSAEQARRAGESAPLSASSRRCFFFFFSPLLLLLLLLRAQIPRNNKSGAELKLHSPQILEEETGLDITSLVVWADLSETFYACFIFNFFLQLFLRDFYNWVVLPKDRPPSAQQFFGCLPSLLHQSSTVDLLCFFFILGRMHA